MVIVKTALSSSKLSGIEYALNPYTGCEHACIYCFAPSVIHWTKGNWGEHVEPKENIARILSKELRSKKKGIVGIGTVTDPYQPLEKKFRITRQCLEVLLAHDFPVCIQTKSSLILRDMDLMKEFSDIEAGITITTLDDTIREKMEPGASSVEERLHTLSELLKNGIRTWVFIGPVMPYLTDVDALKKTLEIYRPAYILTDRLRIRKDNTEKIMKFIEKYYPHLREKYAKIVYA